jgi:PAS domain S-box-containing protein
VSNLVSAQSSAGEQTLEAVLDLAPLAIVTLDLSGKVTRWNTEAERLLGWSAQDVINARTPGAAGEADWIRERCGSALRDGFSQIECRRPKSDGGAVDVQVSVSVTRDGGGRAHGFVAVYVQPTIHTYVRRDDTIDLLGRVAAGIALEINSPSQYVNDNLQFLSDVWLRSVQMFMSLNSLRQQVENHVDTETLRTEIEAACRTAGYADLDFILEEVPKAIAQSIDGVHRVNRIVRAMSDFSKRPGDTRKPIDLNTAVETTMVVATTELRYVADTITNFDLNLPTVWGLPGEINRVIYALFSNAAKAIAHAALVRPGIGTITATTRQVDGWVELSVSDTGTGIPIAVQPHVFEPLFDNGTVGKELGHSLALAYVTIVKHHRGRIWFETTPGVGTTFFVQLPLRRSSGEAR